MRVLGTLISSSKADGLRGRQAELEAVRLDVEGLDLLLSLDHLQLEALSIRRMLAREFVGGVRIREILPVKLEVHPAVDHRHLQHGLVALPKHQLVEPLGGEPRGRSAGEGPALERAILAPAQQGRPHALFEPEVRAMVQAMAEHPEEWPVLHHRLLHHRLQLAAWWAALLLGGGREQRVLRIRERRREEREHMASSSFLLWGSMPVYTSAHFRGGLR